MADKKTLLINMFGGPGCGKSTLASGVFEELKIKGLDCELITEYAKFAVWEDNKTALGNQLYVTAKQLHREYVVLGKVDIAITDSPILLGIMYLKEKNEKKRQAYKTLLLETFKERWSLNFFIRRTHKYSTCGRNESENEAKIIDDRILNLMDTCGINYHVVDGDPEGKKTILSIVKAEAENYIINDDPHSTTLLG